MHLSRGPLPEKKYERLVILGHLFYFIARVDEYYLNKKIFQRLLWELFHMLCQGRVHFNSLQHQDLSL